MTRPLRLTQRTEASGQVVVVVDGEVDMESSPRLLAELQLALRRGAPLVVELAGVTYVDSSGIAVLVQGLKAARRHQQQFRLRAPSEQAIAVLKLAGLSTLFAIDDGRPDDGGPADARKDP